MSKKNSNPKWKEITIYESSMCQGAYCRASTWKLYAGAMEKAAIESGLVAQRRSGRNATFWDLFSKSEWDSAGIHVNPSREQLGEFYRAMRSKLISYGFRITLSTQKDKTMCEQRYNAKLQVVLDFDVDGVWDGDCTMGQIIKQASESGLKRLRNALAHVEKPYSSPRVISTIVTQVTVVQEKK